MNETAYVALLLAPANKTALGLSAMGCFLAASLLGLFFLRGARTSVALLFGAAQAGVYLALLTFTHGDWGFWLYQPCAPLLDMLGVPPVPLDGAHRTLFYGIPAVLHGLLAGGLTLFLWNRLHGASRSGGGSSAPPAAKKGGRKKSRRRKGGKK